MKNKSMTLDEINAFTYLLNYTSGPIEFFSLISGGIKCDSSKLQNSAVLIEKWVNLDKQNRENLLIKMLNKKINGGNPLDLIKKSQLPVSHRKLKPSYLS